ncbi:MAG TPA: pseudouridine synthase [Isosphaeraceae bacterium]
MDQRRPPRRGGQPPAPRGRGPKPADRKPRGRRHAHPTPKDDGGDDRLQKVLAHAGLGSRRACEEFILKGRVTVDGKVVRELGTKVDPRRSKVAVDGEPIHIEPLAYYAVYKPKGYVSTNDDPSGRPRVVDLLPEVPQRVYTVGRLDEMSVGLILLTNDGNLAHKLAHPKYGVEKLYRVVVAGSPTKEVLDQLVEGIWLAEGKVRAKRVRPVGKRGDSTILEMVLSEGKNREVRRMLAKFGHKVMSLTRIAVGPVTIKGLSAGEFRRLTPREVDMLRRVAEGEHIAPFGPDRRPARDARPPRPRPSGPIPPTGPASRRPAQGQGRPPGPPPRPAGRPTGPAARSHGPAPRPPGPSGRPQGPGARRPGPTGPEPRPEGPPRRLVGPPPRSNARPSNEEILVEPAGDDTPRRGRRMIGMESGPAPERRPRPTGKRPMPKSRPKPPRKSLGPLKPRKPRRDESS